MIQECCIQHMDSQSATVRMTMNCSGSRYAPSGLPHQIIRDLKVGVRIILILRLLTQGAVQDNAPGIPLRDFIGNAGRDDGVLTVTTVINGQTGNGEAAADQLVLCQLIHRDFFDDAAICKVKIDIASFQADSVHFNQLLNLGFDLFGDGRLLLLFTQLLIPLKLCLLFSSTASRASRA